MIKILIFVILAFLNPLQQIDAERLRHTNFLTFAYDFLKRGQAMADLESTDNAAQLLKEYDFIVVGAGTAGCALAARLSEVSSWKVLLLEAGGPELLPMDIPIISGLLQVNRDINWSYDTEPSDKYCLGMKDRRCKFPRGRVMGGSSVLSYMMHNRANRRDYDLWALKGNKGWSYKEVLPYFKKLEGSSVPDAEEDFVGRHGPLKVAYPKWRSPVSKAFVQAAQENGSRYVDFNGKRQVGVSYVQANTDPTLRWSANRAYLYPLKGKRPNLHIRKYAMVTKILINPKTKYAYGVIFESNGQSFKVRARREVICSAGAINTPQLLMLSGVGPAKHLRAVGIRPLADLAVGYNLQDHIAPSFNFLANVSTIKLGDVLNVHEWLKLQTHDSKLSLPGGVEALAFYDLEHPSDPDGWPDMEIFLISAGFHISPLAAVSLGIRDDIYHSLYDELIERDSNVFMLFPIVLRPRSKGRIMLKSKDPWQHPLIYPNYLAHPYDLDMVVRGFKKIIQLTQQPAMRHINATLWNRRLPQCSRYGDFSSRKYLECYVRQLTFTIYHQAGTAKMGPWWDRTAVVDARLRVYGIDKLRVVDASIMPQLVAGHPNGPIYMIAEKAADMIKEDYGVL